MQKQSAAPRVNPYSLPWRMLVAPASAWDELASGANAWPALLTQWLLLVFYGILAAKPLAELMDTAKLTSPGAAPIPTTHWLGQLLLYLPINVALAALVALACQAMLLLVAVRVSFRQALTWTAYAALPIFLGRTLGFIGFAIVRPLSISARDAWAIIFNPSPLGLGSLLHLERFSFPWVLATGFDLFGIWCLILLWLGARRYLRLPALQSSWCVLALMLLWVAALTVVWRAMLATPV